MSHDHAADSPNAYKIPVVKVNGELIPEERIAQEVQNHPADSVDRAIMEATEALIIRALLLERSRELGLAGEVNMDSSDAEVEEVIANLLEQEIKTPKADEAACRVYFEANPEKFKSEDLIEASHILLAAAPDDLDGRRQSLADAEKIIGLLCVNPSDFAQLARGHSACPSRETGGSLGQLTRGSTVPEFERKIMTLPEGLAQTPIETRFGYHIVRIDRRIDGEPLPYEQVEEKISHFLDEQVYLKALGQYIQILAAEAEIEGAELRRADSPLVQ
jgi:peptidyl-prolyl cis-trans isomerase C